MLDNTPLTVTLTARQLGYALSAARSQRKKRERQAASSKFVPEPGHADLNAVKMTTLREVESLMTEALTRHLERCAMMDAEASAMNRGVG